MLNITSNGYTIIYWTVLYYCCTFRLIFLSNINTALCINTYFYSKGVTISAGENNSAYSSANKSFWLLSHTEFLGWHGID